MIFKDKQLTNSLSISKKLNRLCFANTMRQQQNYNQFENNNQNTNKNKNYNKSENFDKNNFENIKSLKKKHIEIKKLEKKIQKTIKNKKRLKLTRFVTKIRQNEKYAFIKIEILENNNKFNSFELTKFFITFILFAYADSFDYIIHTIFTTNNLRIQTNYSVQKLLNMLK